MSVTGVLRLRYILIMRNRNSRSIGFLLADHGDNSVDCGHKTRRKHDTAQDSYDKLLMREFWHELAGYVLSWPSAGQDTLS
jgi:hypothetical protein